MNPLIQSKTTPPLLITLALLCFGLLPRGQAVAFRLILMFIPSHAKIGTCYLKFSCAIAAIAALITVATTPDADGAEVKVKKVNGSPTFQITLNGEPFVIKGMNYSPLPIGVAPGDGLPYGDYFTPAYANVWKPDIDKMRQAGINVIKLYAGDPDRNAGAPGSGGNWKDFLDYCYNGGTKPIYVVMFSYTQGAQIAAGGSGPPPNLDDYIRHYDKLVKSTIRHPAVFGYMVGNEIFGDVTENPRFWANFGKLIDAANGAGLSRGQQPFLMTATNDNFTRANFWPAIKRGEESGKLGHLDAWSINVYRGPEFGGSGNSVFTQYLELLNSFRVKRPLIFGEWGTPHTTRPAPRWYGTQCQDNPQEANYCPPPKFEEFNRSIINLDEISNSDMGEGKPYYVAQPVARFLNTQWNTIKTNLMAGDNQVCVGGFIFDWCDEYWKGNNKSAQIGGPSGGFFPVNFAGNYWDEAGFGVSSAVPESAYGPNKPNISRTLFKGYTDGVKVFYNASSWNAGELYSL